MNTVTLTQAAELLIQGKIGVIPTDTVYGIVCDAHNKAAVERLYKLKSREHKPGTLISSQIDKLFNLGFNEQELLLLSKYWPGQISAVLSNNLSKYLTQDIGSLAVRITDHEPLRELLDQTGPIITSSANMPGEPPANNLQEAVAYFGDTVDFYVDGGDLSGRLPSTIIKVTGDTIEILRQGSYKL